MEHQVISNHPDRRGFLKQSAFGMGAFAGLPSLSQALLAADSGSRIEALELLVLKQNSEQRRVLKVISSTGAAGYADFPDLDYAPALGGVARKHLIGANPWAVEAIWSTMRRAGVLCSHRTALDYALWDLLGRETGKPVYELLGGPVRDRIRIYYYGKPPQTAAGKRRRLAHPGARTGQATRCGREGRSLVGFRTIWRQESLGGHGR